MDELAGLAPQETPLTDLAPAWPKSFGRDPTGLKASLGEVGLLQPLVVWATPDGPRLLDGARRREALLALGRTRAPAVWLPAWPPERAADLALRLNLARGWNPAETALLWRRLQYDFGPAAETLAGHLGLARAPKLAARAQAAGALPEAGLKALAEDRLDLESAARLAAWPPADQEAVLKLFAALRPSSQKRRQWLEWLADAARREKVAVRALIAETAGSADSPAAEEAARRRLWRRRHPLLAELTARRQARLAELVLPHGLKLTVDPNFEDLAFNFSGDFSTREELVRLAAALNALLDQPRLETLFHDEA